MKLLEVSWRSSIGQLAQFSVLMCRHARVALVEHMAQTLVRSVIRNATVVAELATLVPRVYKPLGQQPPKPQDSSGERPSRLVSASAAEATTVRPSARSAASPASSVDR